MTDLTLSAAKAHDTPRGQTSLGSRETSANAFAADRSPFSLSIGLSPPPKASQRAEPTEDAAPQNDATATADKMEIPAPPVVRHPLWPDTGGSASVGSEDQADEIARTHASETTVPPGAIPAMPTAGVAARTTTSLSLEESKEKVALASSHDPKSRDTGLAVRASAAWHPDAESVNAVPSGQPVTTKAGALNVTVGLQVTPATPVGSDDPARLHQHAGGAIPLNMEDAHAVIRNHFAETHLQKDPGQRSEMPRQAEVLQIAATSRLTENHHQPGAPRPDSQTDTYRLSDPYRRPDPRIPVLSGAQQLSVIPAPYPMPASYIFHEMVTHQERAGHAPDSTPAGVALSAPLSSPLSGNAGTTVASTSPTTSGAITGQIAAALSQTTLPGVIELKLSPVELGAVRIAMQAGDGVMIVTINAENPQTLDLMRRNSDLLLQEFRNIGHGNVAFQFSGNNDQGRRARDKMPGQDDFDPVITLPTAVASRTKADGLDLRL